MRILDDSDLVCRMYLEGKFRHIDQPLYLYRVHGQNSWLRYNAEIQDGVMAVYDKYIERLVDRWATEHNLAKVEVGNQSSARAGYTATWNLANLPTSSAGVIRATDSFAMLPNPLEIMKQVSRVLVPGGWLFCQVPSTDGRGAWQDPRHISWWNENSFRYYTDARWAKFIDTPVRFQSVRCYTTAKDANQVCWTIAHLLNLKEGYRPCGELAI
jgi:SAM-dependent methyltransferase